MESGASESSSSATPEKKKRRFFTRRKARWALILLAGLVVLAVVFRLLLPTLIMRGTAYGSRYYLGLPARIDDVHLSIYKGTILLEGISVGSEPDAVKPWAAFRKPPVIDSSKALLHFSRISLHWSWKDLFKKRAHLIDFTVEAPSVQLVRESDGSIDPMRHAKPLAPPAKATPPPPTNKPAPEPWAIAVDQFVLQTPDVKVIDPASGQDLLEFSLEKFSLSDLAAKGSDLEFGTVAVDGPVLRVERELILSQQQGGGKTDASKAKSSTAPKTAATTSAAAPGGFRINKVDIDRAKFTWVSKKKGLLDVLMTLKASNITTAQGKQFPIKLALEIEKGKINLDGQVGIFPPYYDGKFSWEGLPGPPLLLASRPELAAWMRSANSSGDLQVTADLAGLKGPPALKFSGRSSASSLEFADPSGKEVSLGVKQIDIVLDELFVPIPEEGKPLRAARVKFESVRIVEPVIHYTNPSPALQELGRAEREGSAAPVSSGSAAPAPAAATPAAAAAYTPPDIFIGTAEVTGADFEVHDTTIQSSPTSAVHELALTAHNVHFPDPSASDVSIQAILPTASKLSIQGSLKPGNEGDYTISLQSLDLPSFSAYSMSMAGVTFETGSVSVQTKMQTHGAAMKIDNDIVINRLGVSMRDPNSFQKEFGVPIDLAVALMSDPAGDIKLKVPLSVDKNGTATVAYGTVIASALRAAILGAVTTPFKLLSAGFGGGGKPGAKGKPGMPGAGAAAGSPFSIAPLNCIPGSAELGPDAPARIDSFAKLLAQRPTMGLVLRGRISAEDRPKVAEQILLERMKAGQGLPEVAGAGFFEKHRIGSVLSKRAKGKDVAISDKDKALYDRYVAAVQIPDERLNALAKDRAGKARDMLVAKGIKPTSITVGEREADGDAGVVISFGKQGAPAAPPAPVKNKKRGT